MSMTSYDKSMTIIVVVLIASFISLMIAGGISSGITNRELIKLEIEKEKTEQMRLATSYPRK